VGYGFVPWRVLDDGEKNYCKKVASTLIEEKHVLLLLSGIILG